MCGMGATIAKLPVKRKEKTPLSLDGRGAGVRVARGEGTSYNTLVAVSSLI